MRLDEVKIYQHVFEDIHVTLVLRFKLFQSIISPTVLYSLDTCPLTEIQKHRIDVTQRVMLRRMVGWTNYGDISWEERGRRMKYRLENALANYPIDDWSASILDRKVKAVSRMSNWPEWTRRAFEWDPYESRHLNLTIPYRSVGRPLTRWEDDIK